MGVAAGPAPRRGRSGPRRRREQCLHDGCQRAVPCGRVHAPPRAAGRAPSRGWRLQLRLRLQRRSARRGRGGAQAERAPDGSDLCLCRVLLLRPWGALLLSCSATASRMRHRIAKKCCAAAAACRAACVLGRGRHGRGRRPKHHRLLQQLHQGGPAAERCVPHGGPPARRPQGGVMVVVIAEALSRFCFAFQPSPLRPCRGSISFCSTKGPTSPHGQTQIQIS